MCAWVEIIVGKLTLLTGDCVFFTFEDTYLSDANSQHNFRNETMQIYLRCGALLERKVKKINDN